MPYLRDVGRSGVLYQPPLGGFWDLESGATGALNWGGGGGGEKQSYLICNLTDGPPSSSLGSAVLNPKP